MQMKLPANEKNFTLLVVLPFWVSQLGDKAVFIPQSLVRLSNCKEH